MASADGINCNLCRHPGSDVRLIGCGCTLHARCTPLSLVLDIRNQGNQEFGVFPPPNTMKSFPCQICQLGRVEGIAILPLRFDELERANELRRNGIGNDPSNGPPGSTRKNSNGSDSPERTGRWTDEEIAYVDYLVSAFDQGTLPLPHGIKLNEFLGDMLICKSSRLTKKMKNAKLSTRSFALCSPQTHSQRIDFQTLSNLQEKFLQSVTSEPTQLELRFNLTKQWRTHFSNLCVQVGYPYLEAREWVSSLEEMERRTSSAEEVIRKVRRKRMSLAVHTDASNSTSSSNFTGGVKADMIASQVNPMVSLDVTESSAPRRLSNSDADSEQGNDDDDDMLSMLEAFDNDGGEPQQKRARTRTLSEDFLSETRKDRSYSEDFESVLRDLMVEPDATTKPPAQVTEKKKPPSHSCGPFLEAITMFMESKNLPFQHADVWVPSFLPRDTKGPSKAVDMEQLRLFHAGYATRGDLDGAVASAFHQFGAYSDNFSFEPGNGLPGRVYTSGQIAWDTGIDEADPTLFLRAPGAKIYGVKTVVGIPLSTPLVGRIVVGMYSRHNIPENLAMAEECAAELMKYSPEPKWKLVIEMNNEPIKVATKLETSRNGHLQVGIPHGQVTPRGFPTQIVGCTSPSGGNISSADQEEQRIVTLLGEHMPLSDGSTGEPSSSAGSSGNLLQHFMSMRLLLLRSAIRRTPRENEMVDVLKSSFRAYAKDNRRSGAELAGLLAKDWVCLKQTFGAMSSTPTMDNQPALRRLSTDSALSQTHAQLLQQVNYNAQQSHGGPMSNPPAQFVQAQTTYGNYRQNVPSRRGSAFSQNSQGLLQPQSILTSRSSDLTKPHM